ncbi:MAG: replication initiator protein [Microviridae sp.]|nr:MAG: replication initiator protein [Microviridae sp.]
MRCTRPRTVGFMADGRTIAWSPKQYIKEYATFQLPCGQCLSCRLEYARQWAVRCVHEAQMHERNSFITLTYSDENLKSTKLIYRDFQLFMKRLRKIQDEPIGVFVTGEYGDQTKRPHWHAIMFNYSPRDAEKKYQTAHGHQVFESESLSSLWGHGLCEFGNVTFESAGYCARYAAKKLGHGIDGSHGYDPISKKSSKYAIGKKWLEKYWYTDCFAQGEIVLPGGRGTTTIPRYYEKWLKDTHPDAWLRYVTEVKIPKMEKSALRAEQENAEYFQTLYARHPSKSNPLTSHQVRDVILKSKFKVLQDNLKL